MSETGGSAHGPPGYTRGSVTPDTDLKAKCARLEARIEELQQGIRDRDESDDYRVIKLERALRPFTFPSMDGEAFTAWGTMGAEILAARAALAEEPHADRGIQIPTENPPSSFRLKRGTP